ncbi:MAG: TIGR03915 family putative DNA repair protein [Chitinophagales bacterium]|nr:TIGR03915 family putative DNA repair protein [Chitinophagales bacterium]
MHTLVYDGTFEGFLSAVFYVYEYKLTGAKIGRQAGTTALFGNTITVYTDEAKAARLLDGLSKKLSPAGLHGLYCSHLADTLQEEDNMLAYIQYVFASQRSIENDYSNFIVLRTQRVERMVNRERHRMKAFIRFKLTKDNIYYAHIEPDFDVLPLIKSHFERRYADQQWLIYDHKRNYGLYYNLQTVETITLNFSEASNQGTNTALLMDEKEELYQTLWQQYFKSVNIASRKNMKLQLQHMPRRYWKLLVEKQEMR